MNQYRIVKQQYAVSGFSHNTNHLFTIQQEKKFLGIKYYVNLETSQYKKCFTKYRGIVRDYSSFITKTHFL